MSEFDEDPDEENESPAIRQMRQRIKELEKQVKEGDATKASLAAAEQRLAVYEADLKLSAKQVKALFASHDGDDFSPEALKATAVELGFAKAEEPVSDEEREAQERVAAASTGAQPEATARFDPRGLSEDEFWRQAEEAGVTSK